MKCCTHKLNENCIQALEHILKKNHLTKPTKGHYENKSIQQTINQTKWKTWKEFWPWCEYSSSIYTAAWTAYIRACSFSKSAPGSRTSSWGTARNPTASRHAACCDGHECSTSLMNFQRQTAPELWQVPITVQAKRNDWLSTELTAYPLSLLPVFNIVDSGTVLRLYDVHTQAHLWYRECAPFIVVFNS